MYNSHRRWHALKAAINNNKFENLNSESRFMVQIVIYLNWIFSVIMPFVT